MKTIPYSLARDAVWWPIKRAMAFPMKTLREAGNVKDVPLFRWVMRKDMMRASIAAFVRIERMLHSSLLGVVSGFMYRVHTGTQAHYLAIRRD
mmetsp:Transcript_18694/g.29717  ORF Transcript_18694/g.29717 Transcript_18694/m.29717 type:complete len:93 (-) Transcript_18694:1458-1736(-)